MIQRFSLPLFVLAISLSSIVAAQQSVQDFSLPPAPTPTASPQVQGPVDTESGVVPVRPRVIETARPGPRVTATPTPTATPAPTATIEPTRTGAPLPLPQPVRTPVPQSERTAPATGQQDLAPVRNEPDFPPVQPSDGTPPIPAPPPAPAIQQGLEPGNTAGPADAEPDTGGVNWLYGLLGLLALVAAGLFAWRRTQSAKPAPQIERPVVPAAAPAPAPDVGDALAIRLGAEKLTRSAMFATLKYRLTLVNRTDRALNDVTVGVDLVSAHSASPMENQVATAATVLEPRHTLARIAPRQTIALEGQVQLALSAAQVIMQGRHPLLVPLMRVRVDGAAKGALVKTFVVGQGQPDGGRVQPFRLDEPPRSYAPIAQRELA